MKLTDGKRTVEIEMQNWTGNGYTPDWSIDFFEAGSLPYNEESDTYTVDDVDYCIEQATDWENSEGDFSEDEIDDSRKVFVTEIVTQAYTVYWVAGDRDGETLGEFETEAEAIKFAREFEKEHKDEFDPSCGGVGIADPDGGEVVDW